MTWAKTLDFALSPEQQRDPDTKLVLVVQDGNKPETVFGTLSIPTQSQVRQSQPVCRWYILRDKKGNEDRQLGRINVGFQWETDKAAFAPFRVGGKYEGDGRDDDDDMGGGGDDASPSGGSERHARFGFVNIRFLSIFDRYIFIYFVNIRL